VRGNQEEPDAVDGNASAQAPQNNDANLAAPHQVGNNHDAQQEDVPFCPFIYHARDPRPGARLSGDDFVALNQNLFPGTFPETEILYGA
jgi:hypothetical protein